MSRSFERVDGHCERGEAFSLRRYLRLVSGDRGTVTRPTPLPASEWSPADLVARLRRTAVALLMAVLLVAPILDCTLHPAEDHAHPAGVVAAPVASISHAVHLHGSGDRPGAHCDQHMIRCVEKSALPSRSTAMLPLLWMALIGMATVAVFALFFADARGIRGPPAAGLPVVSGQAVLVNFCISRR